MKYGLDSFDNQRSLKSELYKKAFFILYNTMEIIIVVVVILIFVMSVIISISKSNDRREKMATRQAALGYVFARVIKHWDNLYTFGISEVDRKVVIIFPDVEYVLNYEDILGVDVVVDGNMVASRSLGKLIGASAIGGIVGALGVDQKISKKVSDIHVDIHTRNLSNPIIRLQVLNTETDMFRNSLDSAKEIANLVKIVIDKVEQEEKAKAMSSPIESTTEAERQDVLSIPIESSNLIAEEVEKLASLKEKGIVTEEKFYVQKKKLLNL